MSELVKKSTEDIKDKLYNCLQSTFEEIEAVKNHLSCIYEGVANDLDTLKTNNEHYSETDELDGYGYGCTNKTCIERIRNKAIDDFANTLIPRLTDAIYQKDVESMTNLINDVAREMKAGGDNEIDRCRCFD